MSKTLRRAALLVLMTMLVCAVAWASGDIDWDTPAAGQDLSGNAAVEMLKDYIRRVNETLVSSGAGKIDPCYELYPTFASLGLDGAEFAQHAEITVNMNATGITSLVLRMDNLTNFALIGGALVQQTSPNSITLDEAVSAVQAYVRKVQESNGNVFVSVSGDESWTATFDAMDNVTSLVSGYYSGAKSPLGSGPYTPAISWHGEGRTCGDENGWFAVICESVVVRALTNPHAAARGCCTIAALR